MTFWGRLTQGRLLTWLQLLYLRGAGEGHPDPTDGRLGEIWTALLDDPRAGRDRWRSVLTEEAQSLGPELVRALMPAGRVPVEELQSTIKWIEHYGGRRGIGDIIVEFQQLGGNAGPALAEPTLNTPYPVAKLVVDLLSPVSGSFYDPAFGMGTVLATAWAERADDNLVIRGQEASSFAWKVAYLRLMLRGADVDLRTGNTLLDDQFGLFKADRIGLQPPWGARGDSGPLLPDDRWPFQQPPRSQEWLWVHHVLYHLAPAGRAVVVVPTSLMHRHGQDVAERSRLLASGVLDAVVDLPAGMTDSPSVRASLLVLDRERRGRMGKVLFVDGRRLDPPRGRRQPQLGDQLRRIIEVFRAWRAGTLEPEARFCDWATTDEIQEAGAVLAPGRFIRYAVPVTDIEGEPLGSRLERLLRETDAPADTLRRTSDMFALLEALDHTTPRSWPVARLGNILSAGPRTGSRKGRKREGVSHRYVSPAFMRTCGGVIGDIPEERTYGRVGPRLTQPGDLLLTSRGIKESQAPACAVVRVEQPLAYSESLVRLRPSKVVDPDYLRLYLTSREAHQALVSTSSGTTISNLRPGALENLEIPLPDLSEQERIASMAGTVEDLVAEFEALAGTMLDLSGTLHEGLISGVFRAVGQQRDCTLASQFGMLKHAVKAKTEARQQLLEPGSRHNFIFYDDADIIKASNNFRVERTPPDPRPDAGIFDQDVTFHLEDNHILIVNHTTTPPKQLTVAVEWTDSRCRYVIGDERLTADEVATRALDTFFSFERATSGM